MGIHLRLPAKQQSSLYQGKGARAPKGGGKGALRPGFSLLSVQRDGVHFSTASLGAAAGRVAAAEASYGEAQAEAAGRVLAVASTYAPALEALAGDVAALDALRSFATAALEAPAEYCVPVLLDGPGALRLEGLRHATVERAQARAFVPNSLALGCGGAGAAGGPGSEGGGDAATLAVVTGPNMGGKSTFSRSVALAAVMCQAGSLVPARSATMPAFDGVFARVGAADAQLRGVSSFMAEMLETGTLLRAATARSLVVIDELGRGTSTYDGFGLAASVAAHLVRRTRCTALFATHFHELAGMVDGSWGAGEGAVVAETAATLRGGARNLHATADATGDDVVMLYRVVPGASRRSFGLHVARMAAFPRAVVERAGEVLGRLVAGDRPPKRGRAERGSDDDGGNGDADGDDEGGGEGEGEAKRAVLA